LSRIHAIIVASIVALAVVIGGTALSRSTAHGSTPAQSGVSARALAARSAQLDAFEASLRRQLAAAPAARPAAAVRYVRARSIVVSVPRHHGDEGESHNSEGQD
jgi:hypothetical protein